MSAMAAFFGVGGEAGGGSGVIERIDAVDQWCLRRILHIRRHDSVRNADIRRITNRPPATFTHH